MKYLIILSLLTFSFHVRSGEENSSGIRIDIQRGDVTESVVIDAVKDGFAELRYKSGTDSSTSSLSKSDYDYLRSKMKKLFVKSHDLSLCPRSYVAFEMDSKSSLACLFASDQHAELAKNIIGLLRFAIR